jgi:hypothetical protein
MIWDKSNNKSFTEHVSNPLFGMSQNIKRKALSVAASLLCYPVCEKNDPVLEIVCACRRDKGRKVDLERKLVRQGTFC